MKKKANSSFRYFLLVLLPCLLWQCKKAETPIVPVPPSPIVYPTFEFKADYPASTEATAILEVTQGSKEVATGIKIIHSINADLTSATEFTPTFEAGAWNKDEVVQYRVTGLTPNVTNYLSVQLSYADTTLYTDTVEVKTVAKNSLGRFNFLSNENLFLGGGFTANGKAYVLANGNLYEYSFEKDTWTKGTENKVNGLLNVSLEVAGQLYLVSKTASGISIYLFDSEGKKLDEYATIDVKGYLLAVANDKLFSIGLSTIDGNTTEKNLNISEIDVVNKKVVKTTTTKVKFHNNAIIAHTVKDKLYIILGNLYNDLGVIHQFDPTNDNITSGVDITGKIGATGIITTSFEFNDKIYYFSDKALEVFDPITLTHKRLQEVELGISSKGFFQQKNKLYVVNTHSSSYLIEIE
jgi:hypothetical protein